MVAFKASRLVWSAMSVISSTTSPIFCADAASPWILALVNSTSFTAPPAISVDCETWRPISLIELDSSVAAEATVWTMVDASSEAAATAVAWPLVCSAIDDIEVAVDSN